MAEIYKTTNMVNGKIYVGKSIKSDSSYLGSGLQINAAIKKYGRENFTKEIIEECLADILDEREIYWIDILDARNTKIGYNISIGGTGGDHYWKTLTEEERKIHNNKISISRTGQQTDYSEERRSNVKAGLNKFWKDKKNDTEWLRSRISPKKYILSDGKDFIRIENLSSFCKENKLSNSKLCSIATGNNINPVKGWYCFYDTDDIDNNNILNKISELKIEGERRYQEFRKRCALPKRIGKIKYFEKNGIIYKCQFGYPRFYTEHGLSPDGARLLAKGKVNEYKGWKYNGSM